MSNQRKYPLNVRLSLIGKKLLLALAKKLGVSQTDVIEMSIRQMAEREAIDTEGGLK